MLFFFRTNSHLTKYDKHLSHNRSTHATNQFCLSGQTSLEIDQTDLRHTSDNFHQINVRPSDVRLIVTVETIDMYKHILSHTQVTHHMRKRARRCQWQIAHLLALISPAVVMRRVGTFEYICCALIMIG